jgi:hypothetical protein
MCGDTADLLDAAAQIAYKQKICLRFETGTGRV